MKRPVCTFTEPRLEGGVRLLLEALPLLQPFGSTRTPVWAVSPCACLGLSRRRSLAPGFRSAQDLSSRSLAVGISVVHGASGRCAQCSKFSCPGMSLPVGGSEKWPFWCELARSPAAGTATLPPEAQATSARRKGFRDQTANPEPCSSQTRHVLATLRLVSFLQRNLCGRSPEHEDTEQNKRTRTLLSADVSRRAFW